MNSIQQALKGNGLWGFYAFFVVTALYLHNGEGMFFSEGAYSKGKPIVWLILIGFLIYTLRINSKENFFKSLKKLHPILWHRQMGLDLYIGLLTPLFIIYLNEGSVLAMLLWFIPILIFANLATLLYLALNYQSIVAHFL